MHYITRQILVSYVTLAKLDVNTGEVLETKTVIRCDRFSKEEMEEIKKQGYVIAGRTERKERFSLPIQEFIHACHEYSIKFKENINNGYQ